jgi:pimeloyl-ACP methyl ester carboxylesterase
MHRSLLALCLALPLVVPAQGATPAGLSSSALPSFTPVACLSLAPGLSADRCGYVRVPEDRARPTGRMVHLAVAIFKSRDRAPAADPLILLWGGPGASFISTLGVNYGPYFLQAFGGHRDLVLVDQRGTGLSRPNLACPELSAAAVSSLDQQLSRKEAEAQTLRAVQRCHDRLVRAGVDLGAYTTLSDAADIAALGPALGYKDVDLYGVSYGTRLALTVMRLYPTRLRSVILDSVAPPQISLYTLALTSQGHILSALLAACAADARCRREYPHFDTTFSAIVARLNAHPAQMEVTVPTSGQDYKMLLTGDLLWVLAFNMLYDSTQNGSAFRMIAAAGRGDVYPASLTAGQRLAEYVDPSAYAWGLSLSDECSEDAPYTTSVQLAAAGRALPAVLRAAALADRLTALQECRIWRVRPVPAWQKGAVRSGIPTLILTGQYDPITPAPLGRLAAQTLPHSFFFTFPGRGHGQIGGDASCPASISAAFLRSPDQRPDASCIAGMPPLTFL